MNRSKSRKSQSAFEFLMTYGWMFLIVLVMAALILSFLDFSLLTPDKVSFKNILKGDGENSYAYAQTSSLHKSQVHVYFRYEDSYVVNITSTESVIIEDGGKKCIGVSAENFVTGDKGTNITIKSSHLSMIIFDCNPSPPPHNYLGELIEGETISGRITIVLKESNTGVKMESKGKVKLRINHN